MILIGSPAWGCRSVAEDRQLTLGIDTSTQVQVGVADGAQVLASRTFDDPRRHVEQLAPLVRDTVAELGVDLSRFTRIVVGVGPGPYTGLRVGIATARVLGQVLGIDVRGVCSLDVIAAQWVRSDHPPQEPFMIITDARRQELYWAGYRTDGSRSSGPHVGKPETLARRSTQVGGPGTLVRPEFEAAEGAPTRLDAGVLAAAGSQLAAAGIEPLYLRNPDAAPPGPRKSVLARPRLLP